MCVVKACQLENKNGNKMKKNKNEYAWEKLKYYIMQSHGICSCTINNYVLAIIMFNKLFSFPILYYAICAIPCIANANKMVFFFCLKRENIMFLTFSQSVTLFRL